MSENGKPTLLVTGASGQLGRRVIELLLEKQAGTIVAATRTPEKLADFAEHGVIVREADFDKPDTMAKAFAGVDRLLLISTDAVRVPGHRLNHQRAAVKAADEAGVKHVVYTSIMNPDDSPAFVSPDHKGTEEALANSTMGWTSLRENIYTDILLYGLIQAVSIGKLFNAIGDGKAAYITREDCAYACAGALASAFEGRRTLDVTGPEAVSQPEVAAMVTEITDQPLEYVPLPLEVLIENMVKAGLPRPVAEGFASFDVAIAQGKFSTVTNAVEELSGHKPMTVREFLMANREALLSPAQAH